MICKIFPTKIGQAAHVAPCPSIASNEKIRTRKQTKHCFRKRMTTEAILRKSIRYDRGGNPVEVVIPYEEFVDFIETYGLDLTADGKELIAEAKADREAGRTENFVALDEISNHPNLKQMGGNMAGWSRLRTGSYRAICSADPGAGWRACPPGSHFRKGVRAV